ncbi:MAG: hypothetical protein ACXVCX_07675, partial [Ktedonobacterales bacterium]
TIAHLSAYPRTRVSKGETRRVRERDDRTVNYKYLGEVGYESAQPPEKPRHLRPIASAIWLS